MIRDHLTSLLVSRQRKSQIRRKAKGICVSCPALSHGRIRCPPCARLFTDRIRSRQKALVTAGLCQTCAKPRGQSESKSLCATCHGKHRIAVTKQNAKRRERRKCG